MKKLILFLAVTICICSRPSLAQSTYKTAVGLGIDFGDGSTIVGPTIKHFFNKNNAVSAEVLFGDSFATIGAFYQYHRSFKEASELKWYFGLGPQILINERDPSLAIRPMVGLDYKIKTVPLSLTFDWRPYFFIDESTDIAVARFDLGLRYAFK